MSSAILYLAIVVIWAFLLVPRWLRRPHTAFFAGTDSAVTDGGDGETGLPSAEPGSDAGDVGDAGESAAPRPGILRAVGLLGARRPSADWPELEQEQPEPDTAPLAPIIIPGPAAEPAPAGPPDAVSASPAATSRRPGEPAGAFQPVGPARPPISRGKILQARRRLLTTLVLLAAAAGTCTALKLTSGWVCVPPAGMLGMYLLLLREAALADAETALRRAEHDDAARQRARARSRQAWAARTPQPTAEIIDISARLGDQLYDQYADATVRAVGD